MHQYQESKSPRVRMSEIRRPFIITANDNNPEQKKNKPHIHCTLCISHCYQSKNKKMSISILLYCYNAHEYVALDMLYAAVSAMSRGRITIHYIARTIEINANSLSGINLHTQTKLNLNAQMHNNNNNRA